MKKILFLSLVFCILFSQTKRDPRVVGLAGTYTTIADGIFSIGYNPGLIGLQQDRPFMLQIGQLDYGILGNFFSIQNIAQYSGDTLDTKEKDQIFRQLRDADGMAFFTDLHFPTPILNISKGIGFYDKAVREGKFKTIMNMPNNNTFELLNKKILIVGFGRIGRKLIKKCLGFEMKVNVYDPYVDKKTIPSFR